MAAYMSAAGKAKSFCGNSEGWGPLSPIRYDFTPCFLDVWISTVALFGLVFGAGAIYWLLKYNSKQPVSKNWHYYTKLLLVASLFGLTLAQAGLQIGNYPDVWLQDFRFYATILTAASILVAFVIHELEHTRSRVPNGVLLFYWLFYLLASAVKLRSLIAQKIEHSHTAYFAVFCASLAVASLIFILEWLVPKKLSPYDALGDEDECPSEYANVFSILTFAWMTPMMKRGYKTFLTEDDLWNLPARNTTKATHDIFETIWQEQLDSKKPSLWLALFKGFSGPFFRGSLFKFVQDTLAFVQPQLLRLLIAFVRSYKTDNPEPVIRGAAIALAMFAVAVIQTTCLHQYFQRAFETGMRLRSALIAAIYQKALRLSNEARSHKTTGDIVNLMAVDTQRISDLTQYGQSIWSAPYQILLCMVSLYSLLGSSMFAGVGIMVVMIPVNALISKIMKSLQKQQMKNKDTRTKLMTEILNNMKSIKLFAWGAAFMQKLTYVRNELELRNLKKIGAVQALANFAWSTTPFMVSCSTFLVFVLTQDEPLSTEIVFPALTLFNLLNFPLSVLPMTITSIVEASVAIGRLTDYFKSEDLQREAVVRHVGVRNTGDESVRLRGASFTWSKHNASPSLNNINFSARKGELSCIVGRVGSGKSSLLSAMLGDLWKLHGEVVIRGSTAYVAQQAWIMNASIKENIVFGHRWDPEFYEMTVQACALTDDFEILPDGDQTEVGEKGISLSGGQKARVSLARAVYARSDIYILDDILSAVDNHVGRHIIEQVIGPKGILNGKARILATNSIPVLKEADQITMIRNGEIVEEGTYSQLMGRSSEIAQLIRTYQAQDDKEGEQGSSSSSTVMGSEDSEIEEDEVDLVSPMGLMARSGIKAKKDGTYSLRRASTASYRGARKPPIDEEAAGREVRTKQTKEFSEKGKVKWSVYGQYAKNANLLAVFFYGGAIILSQAATIGASVWLKNWAEINSRYGGNPEITKNVGIYFAFGIGSSLFSVVQTLLLWIYCSIQASKKLHERMATAIFRSPMSFFETTPAGRILNRFSSDIYRVDEVIARTFNMLFVSAARSLATIVVVSYATPAFIALIIPLTLLYVYYQRYYLRTSRELKRLDSITKSPVYSHFQETLGGISTIRAYRQQKRFGLENEWHMDANLRAYYPSICANRWLAVRLEFIGSLIILASAGFAIIAVASGSDISAGIVGLALSYALQITQSLNWIVRQTVEVETNIVSVERVLEYAQLPSEALDIIPGRRPPSSWPSQGAVSFRNYSTRYRPELDLVLKNINLDIKPREKVGVVGRTGAGKSSLTLALFRIIEPATGEISIDSVKTHSIGLQDLRERISIIPQDAQLFEGTIRDNLDPSHLHDDAELWDVLEHARLRQHIEVMEGGLEGKINEGGSNLSQGQRQLVSLARALLTPSNILVLDEATAAVDVETDALVQNTLRSQAFRDRTIITIAHRINTIFDSDRIVTLDKGEVREFDTPANLIKEKGLFYSLAKEAGLLESDQADLASSGAGAGSGAGSGGSGSSHSR